MNRRYFLRSLFGTVVGAVVYRPDLLMEPDRIVVMPRMAVPSAATFADSVAWRQFEETVSFKPFVTQVLRESPIMALMKERMAASERSLHTALDRRLWVG